MNIKESGEDYLETILVLEKEKGDVRSIDIASAMGYSKPSVSRAMQILKQAQLITMDEQHYIHLTDLGRRRAAAVYERHRLISRLLTEVLEVSPATAEEDACRMEHVISPETFEKMKCFFNKINLDK